MLEVIREMPCDEDFMKWDTNVRRDFLRKWYHTRSKRVRTVSLEECMEDEESGIHYLPDPAGVVFCVYGVCFFFLGSLGLEVGLRCTPLRK